MLQIEVAPEIEQRFAEAAHARGLRPEDYAGELISAAALVSAPPEQVSADELLNGFLSLAHKTPTLSEEAMSRASLYQDHD